MEKVLFLVVGASGSGKDYVVDKMCKDFSMKKVKSRTTRKPRFEGEDTHMFVSELTADEEFNRGDVIAKTNYAGNRYYTLTEDFKDIDFYIIDVKGVTSMNDNILSLLNCCVVYMDTPTLTRYSNMKNRGDKFLSRIKRLYFDKKEFKNFKGDFNFKSSNELYDFIKERKHL